MKESNLKKNLIFQIIYQMIVFIVPLVTTPYISKVLGPTLIGENSYVITIANYFVIFAMLGINNYGSRTISRVKDDANLLNKKFTSILWAHIIISLLVLLTYITFVSFIVKDNFNLYYIAILYIISALLDLNWFFFGLEKFKITITRNIFIKIISIALIFLFVKSKNDLWLYALILAGSSLLSNLYLWIVVWKYTKIVKVEIKDIFINYKELFILFIPVIAVSIYRYMDKLMLGILADKTEVGYYEQTEKIINMGVALVTAIGTVMLPRCTSLFSKGKDSDAIKLIGYSNFFSAFSSIAIAFGLMSVSNCLAMVYLGDEFANCNKLIFYLSITIPIMSFANVIRTHYLIPKKMDIAFILSAILGAVFNLGINLFLIPKYGALGAIIATIGAEFVVCFVQTFAVKRKLRIIRMLIDYIPFLIFGLVMYLSTKYIFINYTYSWKNLILQVTWGAFIYLLLAFIYTMIAKRGYIKKILHKEKNDETNDEKNRRKKA